ncbi:MAG: hypothetical protein KatS3mg090_1017 [Patescibacteria group bacterium]|nr:MAG: hypothetical protein KatS3mg090_1017 [Patescibacteria group bacterium]
MVIEVLSRPELFSLTSISLGLLALAFSKAQKEWIKKRDGYQCQHPDKNHGGRLQVHHIYPQSMAKRQGIDPDTPYNGITLCDEHHKQVHSTPVYDENLNGEFAKKAMKGSLEMFRKGKIWTK